MSCEAKITETIFRKSHNIHYTCISHYSVLQLIYVNETTCNHDVKVCNTSPPSTIEMVYMLDFKEGPNLMLANTLYMAVLI